MTKIINKIAENLELPNIKFVPIAENAKQSYFLTKIYAKTAYLFALKWINFVASV